MHETAFLAEMVRLVEDQLRCTPASRVVTVRLRISPWSHLCGHDASVLDSAFAMVATGSRLEGARLELVSRSSDPSCRHCGDVITADEVGTSCRSCGSVATEVLSMPEVTVHEIVVEE